jgi:ATP phosphoribosyltransferase
MQTNNDNLKIALQRKGRLAEPSIQIMRSIGLDFDFYEGKLFAPCRNFPLDILFLRDDDIPEYVQDGVTDLGIVGINVVEERQAEVCRLDLLGFGACALSIAAPRKGPLRTVFDFQGKRIATSYPRILKRFLDEKKVSAKIIEISGSVEITPSLDVADGICDLVSTGSTLRMNDLEPVEIILKSEAVLIGNAGIFEEGRKKELVERLRIRLQGTIRARKTKYVMMNAPAAALEEITNTLPGMKSPTIVPLAEKDMIAVHAAVPEELFWDVIENLKKAGASDILVVPVEKMVI